MTNEHTNQVNMAQEVGKLLPESIEKVDYYKEVLRAEADLLNKLMERQKRKFIGAVKKAREKVEIINIKNGILHKQKVFESYLARKNKYETWLDEMAIDAQANFDTTLETAKTITKNIRLMQSIASFEETSTTRHLTIQEKVEFYLYLKQEIVNYKAHGKK